MNAGNGPLHGLSSDELRAAIRAVLRDVLPAELTAKSTAVPGAVTGSVTGSVTGAAFTGDVVMRSDADLTALIRRIASLCEEPGARAALREGRHGFQLAGADRRSQSQPARSAGSAESAESAGSVVRIERGAVTERAVAQAAARGTRLVIGSKAVLTPLARDKARILGVEIEKER